MNTPAVRVWWKIEKKNGIANDGYDGDDDDDSDDAGIG
jgi:hypothetical protein